MLPPVIAGHDKACFGVTEPNAGLNTTQITTRAEKRGDRYLINGTKIWTSTAQVANKILLLARTTPLDRVERHSHGLTLFYTTLDRAHAEVRLIHKMGRHAVELRTWCSSRTWKCPRKTASARKAKASAPCCTASTPNACWSPPRPSASAASPCPAQPATHGSASCSVGRSARTRESSIRLAKCWAELEAANLMVMKAAWLYDTGRECGAEANAAKYLAGEAGFRACEQAVMTHGGMGYAQEYHVERYLRESLIPRIAPVSPQLILSYLAERVLDLPKSVLTPVI